MEKIVRTYTPYKDGKWDTIILAQMKEETGFDPPPQEDDCITSGLAFIKSFISNVPTGKVLRIDASSHGDLTLSITEYIEEESE